jgi:hypothetical protein
LSPRVCDPKLAFIRPPHRGLRLLAPGNALRPASPGHLLVTFDLWPPAMLLGLCLAAREELQIPTKWNAYLPIDKGPGGHPSFSRAQLTGAAIASLLCDAFGSPQHLRNGIMSNTDLK